MTAFHPLFIRCGSGMRESVYDSLGPLFLSVFVVFVSIEKSFFFTILYFFHMILCNRPDKRINQIDEVIMMQNNRRAFTENGIHYVFDNGAFKSCIDETAKKNKITRDTIKQDLVDLHDQDIYYDFNEFAYEDLPKVYDGKVGTDNKPDLDDVWEDYAIAMQILNEIVGRIV